MLKTESAATRAAKGRKSAMFKHAEYFAPRNPGYKHEKPIMNKAKEGKSTMPTRWDH